LESIKDKILGQEEEVWGLKSRVLWVKGGDNNTKFFHNFSNHRKNINSSGSIKNQDGVLLTSFPQMVEVGVSCFHNLFLEPPSCTIQDILEVVSLFPSAVSEEMNESLSNEVLEDEVRATLFSMNGGKSHGLDGISVEFFMGYHENIKGYLLKVIRESQISSKIPGQIKSTFIALIPKKQDAESFEYFMPISCCNVIYKLLAKIIAIRFKLVLGQIISEEQSSFLYKRQIHNAMALSQEALHSMSTTKILSFAMNIDLSKVYDRVNWNFLILALVQLGFNIQVENWIMGCVQSASFSVLINGSPTSFFRSSRGIHQGFPLSPFLFLIVEKGLIKLMIRDNRKEGYTRVRVSIF
jgi:mannosylglycoprotein endo-beta-mannosidase